MRIGHVTPKYFPHIGGVEILVKELCERLTTRGFEITVYSLDQDGRQPQRERINGILVKRYRPVLGDPIYLPPLSLLRDLRNDDSEFLHVHNIHSALPALVSLTKKSSQILVLQPHYHRYGQTQARNALFALNKFIAPKLVLNRAKVVIVNSQYEERILKEDFLCSDNVVLVLEGLPLNELKSVLWHPDYPERILYVGGLRRYKGIDKLLRAFKFLLDNEREILKLVVVGDGPDKRRLVKLAHELSINNYIEWKRSLSWAQLLSEYAKARVFVSLSLLESFSRAVYEALAIGVPTVVLGTGIFSDLVNDGTAEGIILPQPEYIAKAILKAKTNSYKPLKKTRIYFQDMDNYVSLIADIYASLG